MKESQLGGISLSLFSGTTNFKSFSFILKKIEKYQNFRPILLTL